MSVLLVVNTVPSGSEGPHNAFRRADALALRDHYVGVLLRGDAVRSACARQDPRGARGLTAAHRVPGVRVAIIHDLAAATARSGEVISL